MCARASASRFCRTKKIYIYIITILSLPFLSFLFFCIFIYYIFLFKSSFKDHSQKEKSVAKKSNVVTHAWLVHVGIFLFLRLNSNFYEKITLSMLLFPHFTYILNLSPLARVKKFSIKSILF